MWDPHLKKHWPETVFVAVKIIKQFDFTTKSSREFCSLQCCNIVVSFSWPCPWLVSHDMSRDTSSKSQTVFLLQHGLICWCKAWPCFLFTCSMLSYLTTHLITQRTNEQAIMYIWHTNNHTSWQNGKGSFFPINVLSFCANNLLLG